MHTKDMTMTEIKMDAKLIEALNWRYATKKFDAERSIDSKDFNTLMEALRLSPSSMGLQPYRFIRVLNKSLRKQLREESYNQAQITDAAELIVFAAKASYTKSDINEFLSVGRALRGYSEEAIEKRAESIEKHVAKFEGDALLEWTSRQLYIAIGQLLTAASLLKIDACPMEGIQGAAYDRLLNLEEVGLRSFAVVTLGYRASDDALAHQAKIRLSQESLVMTK
jgi:nitroreductase